MEQLSVLREFWYFVCYRKVYWALPFLIVLALLGLLIVVSEASALAPFIYPLF